MGDRLRRTIGAILLLAAAGIAGVQGVLVALDSPPATGSPS
jgi:hypothetical protein